MLYTKSKRVQQLNPTRLHAHQFSSTHYAWSFSVSFLLSKSRVVRSPARLRANFKFEESIAVGDPSKLLQGGRCSFMAGLQEVEQKVEILDVDSLRLDPSNLTVVLHEEDHTVGNSLKHVLCKMQDVELCGYNVPHPLEDKILIRLQTKHGVPAADVLLKGLEELKCIFGSIRQKFDSCYALYTTSTTD
ncbi:unnamed protein product [Litomosoides sigmodontis]|uniref:DNA-directed RNA polymerase I subunit D n=1 Tax=Litomosoides sigmodontis TaxID=42156 RepID=A0A3P6SWI0_LITSI|nr:unnamed protein product [Litomosoides sigmodontis]